MIYDLFSFITAYHLPPLVAQALQFVAAVRAAAAGAKSCLTWDQWSAAGVSSSPPSGIRSYASFHPPLERFHPICSYAHLEPSWRAGSLEFVSPSAMLLLLSCVCLSRQLCSGYVPRSNCRPTSSWSNLPLSELPPGLLALNPLMWVLPKPGPSPPDFMPVAGSRAPPSSGPISQKTYVTACYFYY